MQNQTPATKPSTNDSLALSKTIEIMKELVMWFNLNKAAITEDSKQRYRDEARVCVLRIDQYSQSTRDTTVHYLSGEARIMLEFMEKPPKP